MTLNILYRQRFPIYLFNFAVRKLKNNSTTGLDSTIKLQSQINLADKTLSYIGKG